jgi:hypothetical protein
MSIEAEYPDKFVCADCFADPYIQAFINDNAESRVCSYSGRRSRTKNMAAPVDLVIERIYEAISRHYGEAWESGSSWDSEDQRYINETWDTDDLLQEYIELLEDPSGELYEDILNAFPYQEWSKDDPWSATESEVLRWGWEQFVDTVQYQRRFFFARSSQKEELDRDEIDPGSLLKIFGDKAGQNGLLKTIPAGTAMLRCRPRETPSDRFSRAREVGPPPRKYAKQNRMSPAGISMFYGAADKATTLAEMPYDPSHYAVATFHTLRPLLMLDLTEVTSASIFNDSEYADYHWAVFMRGFIAEFTKPIKRDDRVHIEYVPTQIVTEYFRDAVSLGDTAVDGIKYRSARKQGGICYVLFIDQYGVEPNPGDLTGNDAEDERWRRPKNGYTLKLTSIRHYD